MSRETDSASTGPQGHGGGEYGPPGGAPRGESGTAGTGEQARGGARGDERQTETTLTTRVRINIPGSRPIPPVVMRTPVSQAEGEAATAAPDGDTADPADDRATGQGGGDNDSRPGRDSTPKISDWFTPRKPPTRSSSTTGAGQGAPAPTAQGDLPPAPTAQGDFPPAPTVRGDAPPVPTAQGDLPPAPTARGDAPTARRDVGAEPPGGPGTRDRGGRAGHTGSRGLGAAQKLPPGFSLPDAPEAPAPQQPPTGLGGAADASPLGPGSSRSGPGATSSGSSGDTLVGGIPPVPADDRPTAPPPGPPVPRADAEAASDGEAAPATASPRTAPKKKARSRLALLGGALLLALCGVYGAGLMLDKSEVPNGTTVLGVNIGGSTKQEAVQKLEKALGDRTTAPLRITVDKKEHQLKPSVAGLSLDTEATVRDAAGRDWNPVTVIGSLFGGTREVEPAIVVDEEKLRFALEELAGGSGGAREGTVLFRDGRAIPVQGRPYRAPDVDRSVEVVTEAYRQRAASGADTTVSLPMTTRQPRVDSREVQRALREFGRPAMSGWLYLRAGGVEVPFSEQTLSELLSMKPSRNGRLQPVMDLEKLAAAYGGAFDGVMIDAGAGTVPMQPKHAAAAMIEALRKPAPPAPQKRVAEVSSALPPS